jgi:hypothetical protein
MTPLEQALEYARRGWPVFPCRWDGGPRLRKTPLTQNGFKSASSDPETIRRWWLRWPAALIGVPTGAISGIVVLDIDVKRPKANGFDTLEDLGHPLPETPMAHTESGGLHVYCQCPNEQVQNNAGRIGPGLDTRANGGYVIGPSPGSGYSWDSVWNFDTCTPIEAPAWLWPPPPSRPRSTVPLRPSEGLSPYGKAALLGAGDAIVAAGPGKQEVTLNAECFSIGTLAGAGFVPETIALKALLAAASHMRDYDQHWPWRPEEIEAKVHRAFREGVAHPRSMDVRRAR